MSPPLLQVPCALPGLRSPRHKGFSAIEMQMNPIPWDTLDSCPVDADGGLGLFVNSLQHFA